VRTSPRALVALALTACLTIVLAACGSSDKPAAAPGGTTTIASTLVLGGAPTCPNRPYCKIGLEKTYGLKFKSFKALDEGGPLTVAAIQDGSIDVGLIFTTDGNIVDKGWVLLEDDKQLQAADNVTPVLSKKIATEYGQPLADLVNAVSAKLTTEVLTDLNKQTAIDKKDSDDVAKSWLESNDLIPASKPAAVSGTKIVVGSGNFGESVTLANIYADMLEANGYSVSKKLNIGSREIYLPALKRGEVSFMPEYSGTLLTFLTPKQPATTDAEDNATRLEAALAPIGLTALEASEAQDVNGFVVTKETADKYNLVKLSDLAKPAP
jgi:osmoprotectant transport system substrate-binding protein